MLALNRQLFNPIIIVIIALGIIGIGVNFGAALKQVLIGVGVIFVIYLLFRYFSNSTTSANDKNAYNKAVKQSQKKYAPKKQNAPKSSPLNFAQRKASNGNTNSKKKKKQTHLTVIEGEKGKKKDHASY